MNLMFAFALLSLGQPAIGDVSSRLLAIQEGCLVGWVAYYYGGVQRGDNYCEPLEELRGLGGSAETALCRALNSEELVIPAAAVIEELDLDSCLGQLLQVKSEHDDVTAELAHALQIAATPASIARY